MKNIFILLMLTLTTSQTIWAAPQTATLAIPGMNCAACPITIKIALNKVSGVTATKVNFDKREAVVTFDDTKTNLETLLHATENAGYPATLREPAP